MNKHAYDVSLMVLKDMHLWIGCEHEDRGNFEMTMRRVPVHKLRIIEYENYIEIPHQVGSSVERLLLNIDIGAQYIFKMANTHIMYGTPIDLLDTED